MSEGGELATVRRYLHAALVALLVAFVLVVPYDDLTAPLTEVMIAVIVAGTGTYLLLSKRIVTNPEQLAFLIAFVVLSGVLGGGIVLRGEGLGGILDAKWLFTHISLAVAFVVVIDDRETVGQFLWSVALVTAALALLTVVHSFVGLPFGSTRGPGRTMFSITIPFTRGLAAPFAFGSFGIMSVISISYVLSSAYLDVRAGAPFRNLAIYPVLASILVGVVVAQSRSTYVAVTCVFGCYVAFFCLESYDWPTVDRLTGRVRRNAWLVLLPGSVLFLVGFAQVYGMVDVVANPSSTIETRLFGYANAIGELVTRPLLGCGRPCLFSPTVHDHPVHNYWLAVGVYTGVGGLVLSVVPFLLAVLVGLRSLLSDPPNRRAGGILLVGIVVGATVELTFFPGLNSMTGILLGVVGVLFYVSPFSGVRNVG